MGLGRWLGRNSKGEELKPAEIVIQDRIQEAVDQLVQGEKEFGNRTMEADEAEEILRQQGILPKGWRLRESDSTSSGYRPTQSASKKKAALHAGILAGGALAGGYGLAYGLSAGAASGAAGAGAAGAGGAGAAGAAGTGGLLASTAAGVPLMAAGPVAGGVSSGAVGAALAGGGAAAGAGGAAAGLGGAAGTLPSTAAGVPLAAAGPVAGGTSSGAVAAGLGGAGSAGGSSVLGMSPETWELIYGAGSKGLEAYGNSKQASEQRQAELLKAQMGVAADENARDPFRQQMAQIRNLGQFDMMQNMKAPAAAGPTGPYARPPGEGLQPQAYGPSPEMLQWIAMMKQNVASGKNTAPTMTNPANYGKTSVMDLTSTAPTAPTAPQSPAVGGGLTLEQMLALAKRRPTQAEMRFGAADRVSPY